MNKTNQEFYVTMRNINADYFFYTSHRTGAYPLSEDDFFKKHFLPVWKESKGALYKIIPNGYVAEKSGNFIKNTEFDETSVPPNEGWQSENIRFLIEKGNYAAKIDSENPIWQTVYYESAEILPYDLIDFCFSAKSLSATGRVEIFISWMKDGQFQNGSSKVFDIEENWTSCSLEVSAKDYADYMVVWLRTDSENEILVDNVSGVIANYIEN
jgi:hypothetical protein